jgi:AAA+ superfamily predicted ATPase
MISSTSSQAQFLRELRSLLRAPYALIHLQTFEESRALSLIRRLAKADERPVFTWSAITDFDGSPGDGDLGAALERIARSTKPGVFVLEDVHEALDDARTRRRLREICRDESEKQTIILLSPTRLEARELEKDLVRIAMPLPGREVIADACDSVFGDDELDLDRDALVSGAMGLTQREAHRAFHRVRQLYAEALERNAPFDLEQAILQEKQRLIGASEVLEFFPLEHGLDEVGGLENLKRWLGERKKAFSEDAQRYGLPAPKGLLLIGVQGCGKSLTAKAVARHWGLPLLRLDLGVVFDGNRSAEESLRIAIQTSEAIAPCVMWIDEIEKGIGNDSEGRARRVLGSLLTWQQEKKKQVFLVATANEVEALPPEMLRKGRFDEIFFVDLPDIHEREEILEIHLTKRGRHFDDSVVHDIAQRAEYFSGAELEQVVVSAMYSAYAEDREVEPDDLEFAVKETIPLYRTYEERIKALREWAQNRARPASRERRMLDFFE